jgi:hypothetical protein
MTFGQSWQKKVKRKIFEDRGSTSQSVVSYYDFNMIANQLSCLEELPILTLWDDSV